MEPENWQDREIVKKALAFWMENYTKCIKLNNRLMYAEYLYDDSVYCFVRVALRIRRYNCSKWLNKLRFLPDDVIAIETAVNANSLHLKKAIGKPGNFASLKTFRSAFSCIENVRCMRCKGNFSTCSMCISSAELLRNKEKRFTRIKRTLILKWRRKHLAQQACERAALDALRMKAALVDPITQQPLLAFFMPGKNIQ